ncbi:minor capsid protein [Lactiplantibacillus carotarum]|uniref:minor capsid protein n=1 Tax=Lactiplantibacillus carotarum TaxID=2993456 RepID=UPI00298EF101|nr:minor capsid protein [Lactiplantibacillus carotarum]
MPLNVNVNLDGFENKTSPPNFKRAQYALLNQAMSDMEQVVPKDQGHLRDSVHQNAAGNQIIYTMPYAKAQFYGVVNGHRIHNYTTPGTSRRWDLVAKSRYMDIWIKAFTRGLQ